MNPAPIATCAGGIPGDAHLCITCKLRLRYDRPTRPDGKMPRICAVCFLRAIEELCAEDDQPTRHFRELGKGG
jgi:hypothetical protein